MQECDRMIEFDCNLGRHVRRSVLNSAVCLAYSGLVIYLLPIIGYVMAAFTLLYIGLDVRMYFLKKEMRRMRIAVGEDPDTGAPIRPIDGPHFLSL